MSPGAHLSHAARLAGEAQRALIVIQRTLLAVRLHLEAADAYVMPGAEAELAELVEDTGKLADELQWAVDDYAKRDGERQARVAARAAAA